MTLSDNNKKILNALLEDNKYIFNCMRTNTYAADEKQTAIDAYVKNTERVKNVLGIQVDYRKQELERLAQAIKDAEENKEHIDAFTDVIKGVFEDIENPSVNRVYKFNPEKEGRFEVSIEERNRTEIPGVHDPFAELKKEPDVTREN